MTAIGREILATMRDWLMSQGAQIIELDTDGIYFSPPDGITIEGLQNGLSAQLPAGIEVEFDSQYQAMFSYKSKNAAFLRRWRPALSRPRTSAASLHAG